MNQEQIYEGLRAFLQRMGFSTPHKRAEADAWTGQDHRDFHSLMTNFCGVSPEHVTVPTSASLVHPVIVNHPLWKEIVDVVMGREPEPGEDDLMLLGSNVFPSNFKVGDKEYQLGDLVAAAHTKSGLTAKAWNALSEGDRDAKLQAEYATWGAAATPLVAQPEPVAEPVEQPSVDAEPETTAPEPVSDKPQVDEPESKE